MASLRKQISNKFKSSRTTNLHYSKQSSLPAGAITDFVWKDYCTTIFRNIQELGDIRYEDYMVSICNHDTLMELSLRGYGGRPFNVRHDDRFVIKMLKKSEAKVLMDMLPSYYEHTKKYENSLIAKYYGLHASRPGNGGPKVYFVVIENLLRTELQIHRRYDLKGSSQGRNVTRTGLQPILTPLKDIDFDLCFYLDPLTRSQLLEQIQIDCKYLEEQGIMDYSLLLGVHIEPPEQPTTDDKIFQELTKEKSINRDYLDDSIQAESGSDSSCSEKLHPHHRRDPTLSDFFTQYNRPESRFGSKVPARAIQSPERTKEGASRRVAKLRDRTNVFLYIGIIDFLQNYNVIKKIEHAYKSLHYDAKEITSVNPKYYATRFQDFLGKVFIPERSKTQGPVLQTTALS